MKIEKKVKSSSDKLLIEQGRNNGRVGSARLCRLYNLDKDPFIIIFFLSVLCTMPT